MLEAIRKNAQSWGVKVLFGLIVIVFVFWGVGSYRNDKSSVLATINEQPIAIDEFLRAYNQEVESMRQQNPDISTQELKNRNFKQQVFSQLVNSRLLADKARDMGITVAPDEVRDKIRQYPVFQDQNQQFDPSRYQAVLQSNRLSPGQFEADIRQDLMVQKLISTIQLPADVSAEQAKDFYQYAREQLRMEYIFYAWNDYQEDVDLQDSEIKTYYEENQSNFKDPARMKMEYLLITPKALAQYQEINSTEINKYYQANKEQFTQKEEVKTSHILVKLDQDPSEEEIAAARDEIKEIRTKYFEVDDFAQLAKEYSQGPSAAQGGDLGWVSKGQMVPEFEEAAFDLKKGEISQPVRTQFGFHLIKVEDRKKPGVKPLEEVRSQVRQQIAENKAADSLGNTLDQALEMILGGIDLKQTAKEMGLKTRTSSFFTAQKGPQDIDIPKQKISTLFDLKKGQTTESPVLLKNGYLLAQKTEQRPEQILPMEEVRSNIVKTLKKQKAMQLAKQKAQDDLKRINNEQELPANLKKEAKQSEPIGRQGIIPELGMNPELVKALFASQKDEWLPKPYEFSKGYAIARLLEQIEPEIKDWEEQKSIWISNLSKTRKQELFQAYLEEIKEKAKIKVLNPEVLSY